MEELGERLGAFGLVVAERHRHDDPRVELRDERGGTGRRLSAPPSGTQAMSTDPMSPSFSSVSRWPMSPEVDRVQAVELDDERDLLAGLGALRVVAVGPDAGQEDVLDLVLARAVEDERVVKARRQQRVTVARRLALGPRQRVSSGWLNVTMSPVMPRPVGPTTDWIRDRRRRPHPGRAGGRTSARTR